MTSEQTRNKVTSLLGQGVELSLEAEQVSLSNPRIADDLARLAVKMLRQASDLSCDLETAGERRVTGLIAGQLMIHLNDQFGVE